MAFTQQDVVEAYHLLNHGGTPDIKKKADDYLNQFLVGGRDAGVGRGLGAVPRADFREQPAGHQVRGHLRAVQEDPVRLRLPEQGPAPRDRPVPHPAGARPLT